MSEEDLQAELARLKEENERLKARAGRGTSLKVSEKGALSVYGLGRFPVTLYKEQWQKLLGMADEIRAFLKENDAQQAAARAGIFREEANVPDLALEGGVRRLDVLRGDLQELLDVHDTVGRGAGRHAGVGLLEERAREARVSEVLRSDGAAEDRSAI